MPQSPRLLRPRASGFNPRSISGLALWLDASDASSLYTTDAGAVTAVSSPLEISGCVGWWDASDATSITKDGSNLVSQWNDKSGNARHATASGALRPTSGGLQNGRTVMQFTGTQAMSITGNFLQSDNVTMFAVAMKNTDHYGGIISSAPANPEDSPLLGFYSTTLAFVNRRQVVQQAVSNGVYRIIAAQSVGTTQQGWFDGVKTTDSVASVATNTSNTITKIGAFRTSSTADLNGNIAEIVCYGGNLSTTDRARVEAYLAAKWGISGVHAPATATNDPVGAWLDKSGNGRNATQATGASRPTISATNQGGKRALAFASSTTTVVSPATVAQYVADATTSPKMFFAWVARPEGSATSVVFGSPAHPNNASRVFYASDFGVAGNHIVDFGSVSTARLSGTVGDEANNVGHVYSAFRDGAVMSIRRDGVEILRKTNASGGYTDTTGTLSINTTSGGSATSSWMEFMAYAASMPSANVTRLERYLAAKWGITLAPTVSNADAQDWVNRVYANGGTVSASTASAVNQFCSDIDSAGIRDRFYRMGIFAGTGLNSCLVPLYRGPSLGGTQYGNATDTNVGPFVSGDYVETGASGGLTGTNNNTGANKNLVTGLATSALPQIATGHLSAYVATGVSGASIAGILTSWPSGFSGGTVYAIEANRSGSGDILGSWGAAFPGSNFAAVGNGNIMVSRASSTSFKAYKNGSQSGSTVTTSVTPASNTGAGFGLFSNYAGANANYFSGRLCAYSIGAGLSDSEASAFNTAMQAFQTALGRNV
jgi:hypothetical protein